VQTTSEIKAMPGAIIRRVACGAPTNKGNLVSLSSDGKWDPVGARGDGLSSAIALQSGNDGEWIDAVLSGPVSCMEGATVGALIYPSDAIGGLSEDGTEKRGIIGYAETSSILFVQPMKLDFEEDAIDFGSSYPICCYCGLEAGLGLTCDYCNAPTPTWWARLDEMIGAWKRGSA
jgi:hypothetical protein